MSSDREKKPGKKKKKTRRRLPGWFATLFLALSLSQSRCPLVPERPLGSLFCNALFLMLHDNASNS